MSTALISDIHGNRQAFEAVLADIERVGAERIWCLGDLVGYGADPDACVALARERTEICLAGNHDLAVTGALAADEFSAWAHAATDWTRKTIAPDTLAFLEDLSPQAEIEGIGLYHASPRDPVWEYVLSTQQAVECMERQPERLAFIGHSHVALAFGLRDGAPPTGQTRTDGDTVRTNLGKWLLNPGSVGQPRDGDPRAAWLELTHADSESRVTYHRVPYDVDAAGAAIRAAGLPEGLAERLHYGQ